jgi:N-acetylmuramoyl-L-alanine amidase
LEAFEKYLNSTEEKKEIAVKKPKIKIYIDEGHGGNHPQTGQYMTNPRDGKRYIFLDDSGKEILDMREGVINRLMGEAFANLLKKEGIDYEKVSHPYLDRTNTERCLIANKDYEIQKKNGVKCLLISFHSNADGMSMKGKGTNADGWSVWTTRGNTQADRFASLWSEQQRKTFEGGIRYREDLRDGDADIEADFDILFFTAMPAVLVENLFFTNLADSQRLINPAYQQKCAEVCFAALLKYMEVLV